jgi:hypothetical protein
LDTKIHHEETEPQGPKKDWGLKTGGKDPRGLYLAEKN